MKKSKRISGENGSKSEVEVFRYTHMKRKECISQDIVIL
jgi:hypothetical protein